MFSQAIKMPSYQSFGKLLLKSVLVVAVTIYVVECIDMYFKHPTYTDISEVDQTEAPFPAITICPQKYNENVLKVNWRQATEIACQI